jgi:hypothetical protein
MKTRIGSFSILAAALLFGLSTLAFPQTQTKTTSPGTTKTEQKTEKKSIILKDSSKAVKKAPLSHTTHKKAEKHTVKETKTDKKLQ